MGKHWMLGLLLATAVMGMHAARASEGGDPALAYASDVMDEAGACRSQGGDPTNCYVSASPERCKQLAMSLVANPAQYRRAWYLCVHSCGAAGLWSRTVGECSK